MSKKARRRPSWKKRSNSLSLSDIKALASALSNAFVDKLFDICEASLKSGAGNE